jgi:multidrug efflux pump subunit AcrB
MRLTLFPTIGADVITAKLKMPPGSSLQHTASVSHKVETLIKDVVGVGVIYSDHRLYRYYPHPLFG